ncbi:enoyl-CoA hydratase/isomerase family protein [Parahaliea mediterranea]|uniref:Enoyl-CoA hydratase/isomerase family protein n=1 Tax=Parahaliea mediterranea TaxID=651086 RepID=A0A939DGX2_9GAMM|nr:enoyl-CoA hydratase-related protein [Parahaliea mediterranea]MBN7798019.1 enoyl-CoA hydratase/isomerase family protein [Parahaliea mediterranea]
MTDRLLRENHGGVLQLTLNRPEKKNAIDNPLWVAIREAFREAAEDDGVRCVLLTGAGDNFSAGVDLSSFTDTHGDEEHPFESAARAVADFDKPLLAAAHGVAVGGGATVLFHADMVYAGDSLRLRLPFAALALPPEWASSYMLQANIGAQRAAELFYTADWIDAARAVELGVALERVPDEQLLDRALARAEAIARWPVSALREIKRCLRLPHRAAIEAAFVVEREAMYRQAGSADNIEAVTALLEKREPRFGPAKGN